MNVVGKPYRLRPTAARIALHACFDALSQQRLAGLVAAHDHYQAQIDAERALAAQYRALYTTRLRKLRRALALPRSAAEREVRRASRFAALRVPLGRAGRTWAQENMLRECVRAWEGWEEARRTCERWVRYYEALKEGPLVRKECALLRWKRAKAKMRAVRAWEFPRAHRATAGTSASELAARSASVSVKTPRKSGGAGEGLAQDEDARAQVAVGQFEAYEGSRELD